jgi:hypothetical protein
MTLLEPRALLVVRVTITPVVLLPTVTAFFAAAAFSKVTSAHDLFRRLRGTPRGI